jgi:hypothetical protein
VDFSRAFDCLVRENLWFKLIKTGIQGRMLTIVMSMYSCVKSRVWLNGEQSESFECSLGVRQGESLSPFLFAIYINDLEKELNSENAGLTVCGIKIMSIFFADDLVLFSETAQGLQNEIDNLYRYCTKWKLKLNTTKSKIVVFKKGNRPNTQDWYFGGETLLVTDKITYLGVLLTSNGIFHQTQIALADKASKALFMLHKKLSVFASLKPSFMLEMFDTFIGPILFYACEIWGFHAAQSIESLHLRYCKKVLSVRKCVPNNCVYGELGRYPLQVLRYVRIVKYWLHIVSGKKSRYVNILYQDALNNIDKNNRPSWIRSVRSLLLTNGFGEVWINQGVSDPLVFVKLFKQRSLDSFKQNWHSQLNSCSKTRFYSAVKSIHGHSPYLDKVTAQSHRIALTRLLTCGHNLHIESGRWTRPVTPQEQRYCQHCPHKLEDEYHFVIECHRYENNRKHLIPKYYWVRPSMQKTVNLFNTENVSLLKRLAKYVYLAFKIRADS